MSVSKDELLHRLREQLHSGRGHSSLLEELHHLEVICAGEEYNRPLSPLDWITGVSETCWSQWNTTWAKQVLNDDLG